MTTGAQRNGMITLPTYVPIVRQICGVDFVFPEYKEPLAQLKGAVKGYMRGTLPYALADGRLSCAFCDPSGVHSTPGDPYHPRPNLFDRLDTHVRAAHGMSPQEYRDAIGLLRKTTLRSRRMRLRLKETSASHAARLAAASVAARAAAATPDAIARRAEHLRENATAPEYLNKVGLCRDQIMAIATRAAKNRGGTLRVADLVRQNVMPSALRRVGFANSRALATAIGAKLEKETKWTDVEMLRAFAELAERLGHTPTTKDLCQRNGTPSGRTYADRFGGLMGVCGRTGLAPVKGWAKAEGDDVDVLTQYSVLGDYTRVAQAVHRGPLAVAQILAKYGVVPSNREVERKKAREWAAEMAQRLAS